jgi:polyribonucleotide nucleotidyltransferase
LATTFSSHCPPPIPSLLIVLTALNQKKKTTTIAVEVKKSQHKYVIGPKGNSLQEILERTGVSVEIPPSDSISETVILRGEPEKLGQALTEVYAKVAPTDGEVFVLMTLETYGPALDLSWGLKQCGDTYL